MGGSEHRKGERWAFPSIPTKGLEWPSLARAAHFLPKQRVQTAMRPAQAAPWAATDGARQADCRRCLQREPGSLGWEGLAR